MNQEPAGFFKRKTTWAALASIFGGIGGAATGQMSVPDGGMLAFQGIMALCLRSAVAKLQPNQPPQE